MPPVSPDSCCSRCAQSAREARLERARGAAAQRQLRLQQEHARSREALLGAALLDTAAEQDARRIADLELRLKTATDEIARLQQAAELARGPWWSRLFHRRGP